MPGLHRLFGKHAKDQSNGVFLHFLWPLTFDCSQPRSSSDSQPPESSIQNAELAVSEAGVQVQTSSLADTEQEAPFTEVHSQLTPTNQQEEEKEEKEIEEEKREEELEEERGVREEGVNEEYALSSTLRVEEKEEEQPVDEEQPDKN